MVTAICVELVPRATPTVMKLFHKQFLVEQIRFTAGRDKHEFRVDFPKPRQIWNLEPDVVF